MIDKLLKEASLKNTKQRHAILSVIGETNEPATAEEIYEILQKRNMGINLSTIYRTLNTFLEHNIILKILKDDGTASFQYNDSRHNHYITCYKCRNSVLIDKCPLKNLNDEIKRETGFELTGHNLQLTGLCPNCLKSK